MDKKETEKQKNGLVYLTLKEIKRLSAKGRIEQVSPPIIVMRGSSKAREDALLEKKRYRGANAYTTGRGMTETSPDNSSLGRAGLSCCDTEYTPMVFYRIKQ
jgi:hypothetical protein